MKFSFTLPLFMVVIVCISSTEATKSQSKHNQCHQLTNEVILCTTGFHKGVILPTFNVKLSNNSDKFDRFWDTKVKQLKVKIEEPRNWKDEVAKSKTFKYYNVALATVKQVKFTNKNYQSLKTKLVPCVHFVDDQWITVTNKLAELNLYQTEQKKSCFSNVDADMIQEYIVVLYKVNEVKTNETFESHLNVELEAATTTTTTTTTTTPKPTTLPSKITIQQRVDGSVSFKKTWREYVTGFGDPTGNFWIGLEQMHKLTKNGAYKIKMEMKRFGDKSMLYATYNSFKIGSSATKYKLSVGEYDSRQSNFEAEFRGVRLGFLENNNKEFATFDSESKHKCSTSHGGAGWWFYGKDCSEVNPNGIWYPKKKESTNSIYWYMLDRSNGLKYFRMLLIKK